MAETAWSWGEPLHKAPSTQGAVAQRSLTNEAARLAREANPDTSGDSALGPGRGIPSVPLDARTGIPRLAQYPTGVNQQTTPGSPFRRVDFDTLKQLADTYDLLRKAININISEMVSLPWDITVRNADRPDVKERLAAAQPRIDAIKERFRKPDLRNSYQSWLKKGLEDLYVGDYAALSTWRNMRGDVIGWRWIDGATIKIRMDDAGEIPMRPQIAYQQILYGMPHFDFFEASDMLPYLDACRQWQVGDFVPPGAAGTLPGELRYRPMVRRNKTPYGFSAVEYFMSRVNAALRHQMWEAAFWTDGNIPSAFMAAPPTWTADQIIEFQTLWDTVVAGDVAQQRRLRWIPGGSELSNIDNALGHSQEFADYLTDMVCVAMDLTRADLGFEPEHEGNGEFMEKRRQRISVRPTAEYLKVEWFDQMLQEDLGESDLEWVWPSLRATDAREQAEVNEILIRSGQKSIDQVIAENGGTPPGIGLMYSTGAQILMEHDLLQATKTGIGSLAASAPTFTGGAAHQPIEPGQHSGRSKQPDNSAPAGTTAPSGGKTTSADLRKWRTKALKNVKAAGSAQVPFSSEEIEQETYDTIAGLLTLCVDAESVRQVFDPYL